MFGGGSAKRDDGLPAITSSNIFSALESKRRKSSKKRSSEKEKTIDLISKGESTSNRKDSQPVWTATPVSVTSWADCEEDDDDDYFAIPALPPLPSSDQAKDASKISSRDDDDDGIEDDDEEVDDYLSQGEESDSEEHDDEPNGVESYFQASDPVSAMNLTPIAPAIAKEPDRQLSKKELKKKELAELEAVLAELGLNQQDVQDVSPTIAGDKGDANGVMHVPSETGPSLTESKSSKKKKGKKDKSTKEGKEDEETRDTSTVSKEVIEDMVAETVLGPTDKKEVLKKLASMKKKKSFKDGDLSAKAVAAEAAVRAAKLAAAKKKEKNHYNQQPVR